jgi:hypothetical protein
VIETKNVEPISTTDEIETERERVVFSSLAFSWTMIDFHVCAQLAEERKTRAGSAAAAHIYAYMQENCNNNNNKRAPYKSNGVVVQV